MRDLQGEREFRSGCGLAARWLPHAGGSATCKFRKLGTSINLEFCRPGFSPGPNFLCIPAGCFRQSTIPGIRCASFGLQTVARLERRDSRESLSHLRQPAPAVTESNPCVTPQQERLQRVIRRNARGSSTTVEVSPVSSESTISKTSSGT